MSRLLPYAQLLRLPNVFTALADIALGALAAGALPAQWLPFLLLSLASACLYCAGMVWNDFFDIEQDRRERPFRPIPSGRVPRRTAGLVGAALMVLGVWFAALAGWRGEGGWHTAPLLVALLLGAAILLYDSALKRTPAGPLAMGTCRFLNVLLGLSAGAEAFPLRGYHLAAVVGLYIVGVTWFARTEARESSRSALRLAAVVMLLSLALALPLPEYDSRRLSPERWTRVFPYLLVAFGFFIGIPVVRAFSRPVPGLVQAAVKRAIIGLILLDATLAVALAGPVGLAILVLLVPTLTLGRWVYST